MGTVSILLASAGCATAPAAPVDCAGVYAATVVSLGPVIAGGGAGPARFPSASDYVARCAALGFDADQLRCLAPDVARADPAGCAAALGPARDRVDELAAWFAEHTVLPGGSTP
ncbi:MAG: hypothetical protein ABMB14_02825 [Myxococcota bacterium]